MPVSSRPVSAAPRAGDRRTLRLWAIALCVASIGVLTLASQASADVYWTSSGSTTISRANEDGGEIDSNFIAGLANGPSGVAVDGDYIYWLSNGSESIGRAKLGASGATEVDEEFIPGVENLQGIAAGGGYVYWSSEETEAIERVDLQGQGREVVSPGSEPRQIAVGGNYVYWVENGKISRATVDGSVVEKAYLSTPSLSHGIAADASYLYVTLDQEGRIARVDLATKSLDPNFVTGVPVPVTPAVNAAHIFWGSGFTGNQAVGRADIDGAGANDTFIAGSGGEILGVAVDPAPTPEPPPTPTPTPDPTPTPTPSGSGGTSPTATKEQPPVAAPAPVAARYKFGIKKILRAQGKGTAKLRIRYNGPGLIELSGKRVESVSRRTKAGISYLPIVPNEALANLLKERNRVHVSVRVQFTPDAGVGRIKEKKVGVWLYG